MRKADEHHLLAEGHRFWASGVTSQRCLEARVVGKGPLRASLQLLIEIGGEPGGLAGVEPAGDGRFAVPHDWSINLGR